MLFQQIKRNLSVSDTDFDALYPKTIKDIANQHFSPFRVSKMAALYLCENKKGVKVLDVGAGAGKFCLIAAACTEGDFIGIEQRKNLCELAETLALTHHLPNARFIHANVLDISFADYDAFYLYNPFYENIWPLEKLDNQIELKRSLYIEYSEYVRQQLDTMPIGTKLATYYSFLAEIPESYQLQSSAFGGKLKFWEKVR